MIKEWNGENYECKIDNCKKQKKQQFTVMGKLVKLASRSGKSFLHTQESISFSLIIEAYLSVLISRGNYYSINERLFQASA